MTYKDTSNATSLPESESGRTRSGWQAGRTTDQPGQDHALASPSQSRESAAVQMTLGISGLPVPDIATKLNMSEQRARQLILDEMQFVKFGKTIRVRHEDFICYINEKQFGSTVVRD